MKKQYNKPVVFTSIILLFLIVWVVAEKQYSKKLAFEELRNRSISITGALKGSLQSEVRRGQMRIDKIKNTLENVIATTDIETIIIKNNDTVLFKVGQDLKEINRLHTSQNYILLENYFIYKETVNMQKCSPKRNRENNKKYDIDLHKSQQTIIIALSLKDYDKNMSNANRYLSISFVLISSILFLSVYFWVLSIKNSLKTLELNKIKTRADRLEELGLTAAGIAHETKNPLGIIRGLAQQILKHSDNKKNIEMAELIIDKSDLAADRLCAFVDYAKMRSPEISKINAKQILEEISQLIKSDFNDMNVEFTVKADDIAIYADKEMLNQILINLIINSRDAVKAGDKVSIELLNKNKKIELIVKDTGSGINKELLKNIFKPYVTGKENGHGIGLSLVKRFVEEMDWSIDIISEENKGTVVKISGIK